jgi:hypothetical protein
MEDPDESVGFKKSSHKSKKEKKREKQERERLNKLNDTNWEFTEEKENKLREIRLRAKNSLPFKPKFNNKVKDKDAENKKYSKDLKKYQQFNKDFGSNIFLMNFFKALQTIVDLKQWLLESSFYTHEVKNTKLSTKGTPKFSKRRTGSKKKTHSKFETRKHMSTKSEKLKLFNSFIRDIMGQFVSVQELNFDLKIKQFKDFLNNGDSKIKLLFRKLPNLLNFIIKNLDCTQLDDFIQL